MSKRRYPHYNSEKLNVVLFTTNEQRKWLKENLPTAKKHRIMADYYRKARSYQEGRWSGMIDQIFFENETDFIFFRMRWT